MASGLVDAWFSIWIKDCKEIPSPGPLPALPGWEVAYPSLRMQFVALARSYRAKLGLSQTEAAKRLGVDQSQYCRLEDPSKANPTLATVQKVARVLHLPVCLATEAFK